MISFLVAMDQNGLIGRDNDLPWRLPADLAYFKKLTTGHTIIMGRKTYESIGRPLPERKNIVITRDAHYQAQGCVIVCSVAEALAHVKEEDNVFVIGGAEIFKAFYPYAERLYITCIEHEFQGDTYFPSINWQEWQLISKKKGITDEKNQYKHAFLVYERRSK